MKHIERPKSQATRLVEFVLAFFSVVGAGNLALDLLSGTNWGEALHMLTSRTGQAVAVGYSLLVALFLRYARVLR